MRILLASIYPFAFMLLFLIIPFDEYVRALPNVLLIILVITFPSIIKREHFQKIKRVPFLLLLLFFCYVVGNSLLQGRIETDWNIIKKIAIAVGLVVLYLPVQHDRKIQKAIIFSSLAAIGMSVISIVYAANTLVGFEFGDSQMMIEALLVDRLYLGLISVLSILFCYRSMRKTYHPHNRYYLAAIVINVLFIFLVVSKIAAVVLVAIVLLRQTYGKQKKLRISIAISATTLLIAGGLFLKFQLDKNTPQAKTYKQQLESFVDNSHTFDTRTTAWNCSLHIFSTETLNLTGLGFNETKDKLVHCYENHIQETEKKNRFVSQRYNTHSQFLDLLLSTGILGLVLFVAFLIYAFMLNREKFFPTAMLVTLIGYCLVEAMFHRQIGAYYFGMMLIVILANDNYREIDTPKEV